MAIIPNIGGGSMGKDLDASSKFAKSTNDMG